MTLPPIVSPKEWQVARDALLVKEKKLTRALDALAAERRRLPMVEFTGSHEFDGPSGKATLVDLFDGRRQLIVYHFMMQTGSDNRCPGCSGFTDNIPAQMAHLNARDTTFALTSPAPQSQVQPYRERMGWDVPWYSAEPDGDFYRELGLGGGFGLSAFLRDGDRVFRTYFTTSRGVDRLRTDFNLLDMTVLGRQESWEDSPAGWPQDPTYSWVRLHDQYAGWNERHVLAAGGAR